MGPDLMAILTYICIQEVLTSVLPLPLEQATLGYLLRPTPPS